MKSSQLRPFLWVLPFLAAATLLFAPPAAVCGSGASSSGKNGSGAPGPGVLTYSEDGSYILPKNYREWVFLSSGIDMVYSPKSSASAHSKFDNVFVDPAAYRSFLANGTWPDKTVIVLEVRAAETNPSINQGGHSQGAQISGMEVHLKDASRYAGKWAFFDVNSSGVGKLIPQPASCYTCHSEHAAVDTTFVQFYPTLFPLAKEKGTLSPAYLKEFGPELGSPAQAK